MRIIVQRVNQAEVSVQGNCLGKIDKGLMLLCGFGQHDAQLDLRAVRDKVLGMRIFSDAQGRFQHSVQDVCGNVLLVPQFTLYGDTSRGKRPDFSAAMKPPEAKQMFAELVDCFREILPEIQTGEFGAYMKVSLENDGPVTIILDW